MVHPLTLSVNSCQSQIDDDDGTRLYLWTVYITQYSVGWLVGWLHFAEWLLYCRLCENISICLPHKIYFFGIYRFIYDYCSVVYEIPKCSPKYMSFRFKYIFCCLFYDTFSVTGLYSGKHCYFSAHSVVHRRLIVDRTAWIQRALTPYYKLANKCSVIMNRPWPPLTGRFVI